jgi:hypothetical protein
MQFKRIFYLGLIIFLMTFYTVFGADIPLGPTFDDTYFDLSGGSLTLKTGGLVDIFGLAKTDSNIIVGDGTNWVAESGATARTSLGLAIGTNVQAYDAALASISGLTYVSPSFIKLTAEDTYAVRTLTEVKTDLAYQLSDMSDIDLTDLANEKVLQYNSTTEKWECEDAAGGGGYTNLTSFVDQTAWRLFYSNADGDVTELALGTDGQVLTATGVDSAPAFEDAAGGGETNTASNVGDEVEIYKQKDGVDLEFRTLKANSGKITIENTVNDELKLSNEANNDDTYFISGQYRGQTWTPVGDYTLGIVSVYAKRYGVGATMTMHISAADGDGWPTGDELGSVALDCTGISTSLAWIDFDLTSENISLTSGVSYCWYISGGTGSAGIIGRYASSNQIADSWYIYYESSTWRKNTSWDYTFKLYSAADYIDNIEIDVVPSEIPLDTLGAPTDITDLDASTSAHGLLPKLPFSGDLLSTTTVSFAVDADTTLYTVPTGKRCVLTHAIVVAADDAGATTTMSIGANGTETDFVPANTLSNLDAQYDSVILQPIPNTTPLKIKSYAAATVIEAQVASNSGAAGNTVYLYGILY